MRKAFVAIDEIAEVLHQTWRRSREPKPNPLDVDYADLSEDAKEENRAAARRIAESLAGLGIHLANVGQDAARKRSAAKVSGRALESLAQAEHEGWRKRRESLGWTFARVRNDVDKKHPSLVDYKDLTEIEKEKDRELVRSYLRAIEAAGFALVLNGEGSS